VSEVATAGRRVVRPRATIAAVAALTGLWLAMMVGGTGSLDLYLLGQLYSADSPATQAFARFVTLFGEWPVVLLSGLIAAAVLWAMKRKRSALLLLAVTLVGRALVALLKNGVQRQRPDAHEHLVPVASLSFPSAHAANSMILFLSLALIAAPRHHHRWTVPMALAGTFMVGISRPMLGVHWPSDVVGGWSFGAAWVLAMLMVAERWPGERHSPR
jgi:undecaprenyl-diphosphatase